MVSTHKKQPRKVLKGSMLKIAIFIAFLLALFYYVTVNFRDVDIEIQDARTKLEDFGIDQTHRAMFQILSNSTKNPGEPGKLVGDATTITKLWNSVVKHGIGSLDQSGSEVNFNHVRQQARTYYQIYTVFNDFPYSYTHEQSSLASLLQQLQQKMFPWLKTNPLSLKSSYKGRGIVIAAGSKQFNTAVHTILGLRSIKCDLPIEVVYRGSQGRDLEDWQVNFLSKLPNVKAVDATTIFKFEENDIEKWAIKPFSILGSSFAEVIYIDANVLFLQDPTKLFDFATYKDIGTVFFYDRTDNRKEQLSHRWVRSFLPDPSSQLKNSRFWNFKSIHEQDSGVIVLDKRKTILELLIVCMMNSGKIGSETYKYVHGDKETYWIAWEMVRSTYAFVPGFGGAIGYSHIVSRRGAKTAEESPIFIGDNSTSTDPSLIGQYVCGLLHHPDDRGRVMWWRGSVMFDSHLNPELILNFTHWATDKNQEVMKKGVWRFTDPQVSWTPVTPSTSCIKPLDPENEINALSIAEKGLISEFVKTWKEILAWEAEEYKGKLPSLSG